MSDITLLGPQVPVSNLREALRGLGIEGRVCAITAGWQEREAELGELAGALANPVQDLRLYARCEEVFGADQALFDAHRERQDHLIALQRAYRVRLAHALAAVRELALADGPPAVMDSQRRAANTALRSLDRHHLREIRRVHAEFERHWPLAGRPAATRQREAIAQRIQASEAVLVAGGHVAVLLGRLRLLDMGGLLAGRTVIAWSAGAMAIAERVVLFHDHPPQGAGDPEVLDAGLGLVTATVPLPDAAARLALGDSRRVAMFARRFSPAVALTFDNGALLRSVDGRVQRAEGVKRLCTTGGLAAVHST